MEYEQDGIRVTFDSKKMPNGVVPPMAPIAAQAAPNVETAQPEVDNNKYVTSPLVGTFHCAPTPNGKPFVTEGAKVNKGDKLDLRLVNGIVHTTVDSTEEVSL